MFKKRMKAKESKELFLGSFHAISSIENLPIEECDGRIISENISAEMDVPHYHRAAMDGFAVIASETYGAGSGSPIILKLADHIENGTCVRVHTGSPMPHGADAVVMVEDTILNGDKVEIFAKIHPFKNVGAIGEDVARGEIILKKRHLLRPCDIAVIASLGIEKTNVFKRPHVLIIPTGEELVARNKRNLLEGEIYETNGMMTAMYVRKWGGIPHLLDIVTDSPGKIREAIFSKPDADMIITSGGTSVGKRDYVPSVIGSEGRLLVHGVGISPGKPTALGLINNKPVVCLPGYPVAGIVALFYFGRAALRKLGNIPDFPDRTIHTVLSGKITGRTGYLTFARVKIENSTAVPMATMGAGILSSVSRADGFVIIPENIEGRNAGEEVEVVLIE